jgi:hypothetical protein
VNFVVVMPNMRRYTHFMVRLKRVQQFSCSNYFSGVHLSYSNYFDSFFNEVVMKDNNHCDLSLVGALMSALKSRIGELRSSCVR